MRRLGLFLAVLAALAGVYAIAWRTQPGNARPGPRPAAQAAAVTSITRSCPPAAPGAGPARIAMIAMPAGQAAAKPGTAVPVGSATITALPPAAPTAPAAGAVQTAPGKAGPAGQRSRQVTSSVPGVATTVTAPGTGPDAAAVAAAGQMAGGFEAEQANAEGIGLVSCTHPSSDMWFVGTGTAAGAPEVWLYLMNSGTLAANADVTILTDSGQQSGPGTAITVAPHQCVAENIAPFARGSQAIALHVQTSSGQVAASVWEGGRAGGGAWLPQSQAPATTLVIPGLTVASSPAKLFVTVPGPADARLNMVAYTPSGPVAQFTHIPVEASAGATTPVTLSALGASAAGLKLTSNVPIVAGVLVPGAGIGSFAAAVPPVTQQGIVAGNPAARGLTVGVLLTAPASAARVSVAVVGADGSVASPPALRAITVRAGRTLAVAVPRPAGRQPFAVVLTPLARSGPLYAVRVVTAGTGGLSAAVTSLLPVPSALTSIALPPVRNSYDAVMP